MVSDTDFIVITGNILRSVNDIPGPSLNREYRYTKICYTGVLPHTDFTMAFAGQTIVDRYTGNIVIPKIVKPGFHYMAALLLIIN